MKSESRFGPLIERYATGGPTLAYAVAGLSPEHEKARPGPGAWSIAELVAHLLDADLVLAERMKRVLAEDEPVLQAFDENAWAARLDYQAMSVEEAVNLLIANRRWMAQVLRRCVEADFARAGRHSERGRQTMAEVLSTVVNHIDHHLRFLYAKRANLGVALPPRYTAQ
ncbi:MAG: DinB family protein [Isosphaeraceae bacterium]|nr:DinB family protein [Isosphaeraceae bacterium]